MKKKILITGVSSGIGKATAELLLKEGFSIVGISRRRSSLEGQKDFHSFCFDLTQLDQLPEFFKKVEEAHPQIDGLICNAATGYFGHLEELCVTKMRKVVDLNFLSPVLLLHHFFPQFKKRKNGEIFLIGSEAADKEQKQGSIYGATKAALRSFARAIKEECRYSGVKVHLISPGMVRTPFYDDLSFSPSDKEDAALLPQDIAKIILFILTLEKQVLLEEITLSPLRKEISFSHRKTPKKE
jgi:3-hydroxy acid dehydrogenase / malonic semialdehyde reductase